MSEQHDAVDEHAVDESNLDESNVEHLGVENARTSAATAPATEASLSTGQDPRDTPDPVESIDLDAIEADLTDVQRALDRLNDGSYWTDEITGESIPDDVLVTSPLARTVATTLN